ncbi:MAG: calcium/sodium antiporter [Epsilonproteobacteria bacterium]|nr:calcium/sodium antiporter [Campylobacterota bacterium]
MDYLIFIVSMTALVFGANYIIVESEKIALHFDISPFIIGATLIALGTSLPEMATSITASFYGKTDIAVANVVGSVIFNISLVLGVIFLLAKNIKPVRDIFKQDSAWIIIPPLLFLLVSYDGVISRFDGFIFILLMVAYLLFLAQDSKTIESEIDEEILKEKFSWSKTSFLLLIGFIFVIVGSNFTIQSASNIASSLGVSQWIIGLILIAFGTSLPELTVSIIAVKKGNVDMAIGNIIGSNVANFAVVLGAAALVNPLHVDLLKNAFDILTLFAISIILIYISATKMYNKSAGIILLSILTLFITHSIG